MEPVPRQVLQRLDALAGEFEADGQRYCAADLRIILSAYKESEEARRRAEADCTRWLGKLSTERLRQVRRDALAILKERPPDKGGRQLYSPETTDAVCLALADPAMTALSAARALGVSKGVVSGHVNRVGGMNAARARGQALSPPSSEDGR